uniref:CEP63/Deup1 N-terminal domain-containing protein n=1 Tax=Chrysemys picta bellii TaxID=8478 RepID=A0A8C3FYI7_CHRPI
MEKKSHRTDAASPCEAELQELVHQIDIMVNNKKLEWERKVRALEARMDVRDQELANAQSKLDLKGQELIQSGILKSKLVHRIIEYQGWKGPQQVI